MATQNGAQVAPPGKKLRIAVLTSGGDSAGMNAAVRAVVKQAMIRSVLSSRSTRRCRHRFCPSILMCSLM